MGNKVPSNRSEPVVFWVFGPPAIKRQENAMDVCSVGFLAPLPAQVNLPTLCSFRSHLPELESCSRYG